MQGAVAPLEIIFGGAHKIQEFRRSITHFNAQPCTAPAQQIISFTSSQLAVPPGLMGCQVAEWLVSPIPLQGPKSLICLENNIESKRRSWADIREASYKQKVFQKMFSQQHDVHFGSQGEGTALTLVHTCSSTGFSTVQLSTRMCVSAQTQAKPSPQKAKPTACPSFGPNISIRRLLLQRMQSSFVSLCRWMQAPGANSQNKNKRKQGRLSHFQPCTQKHTKALLFSPLTLPKP